MDWWIASHQAEISKRAFEIYQRRMRGEIPHEEIDRILREYGIISNTRAADEFMQTWDWNRAIEELQAEERAGIAREAAEKEKKCLGSGVYIGDLFPLLPGIDTQIALAEISDVTFEELIEIINSSGWAFATRNHVNLITLIIMEADGEGSIFGCKYEREIVQRYGILRDHRLALPAEAKIEGNKVIVPFVQRLSPTHRSFSIHDKDKQVKKFTKQGYKYMGIREWSNDHFAGEEHVLRKPGESTSSEEVIDRQEKLRISGRRCSGFGKFKNFDIFIVKKK